MPHLNGNWVIKVIRGFSLFTSITLIALITFSSSSIVPNEKHSAKGKVILQFEHYVGNELLKLDSTTYKNELGQIYTVSRFKYYISNIHLKKKDGTDFSLPGYFIVNEEEDSSKQIMLNDIPNGEYTSISFMIGVDSIHNCSGAQSGALDPLNGMFWAWNTGYIFLKMDGHSPASASSDNMLEFHVGGYKQPANCIRTVSLSFKKENVKVGTEGNHVIKIKTDLATLFKRPHPIDFSKISVVSDFHNATTIADNYAGMFSILGDDQ